MVINNIPRYAYEYPEIVVTKVDNEYWFYGAYNEDEGERVAFEVGGEVITDF